MLQSPVSRSDLKVPQKSRSVGPGQGQYVRIGSLASPLAKMSTIVGKPGISTGNLYV
jgi:hypothetical protein